MLPGLLRDIMLLNPSVADIGLNSGEKHEEFFTGIIDRAITMVTPHSTPWVIGVIAGAYSGIKITKYDVRIIWDNCC